MKKISILKDGQLTHQMTGSEEEYLAWLNSHQAQETFGKNELKSYESRIISEEVLGVNGELISPEISEIIEVILEEADYEILIEDLSEILDREKTNEEALKFLQESDFKVIRHLDQQNLGIATSLTAEEFQELLRERQMAREAIIK